MTVPIPNYPFEPETVADLLLGGKAYFSFVSIPKLIKHLEADGWVVTDLVGATAPDELMHGPDHSIFYLARGDDESQNVTFPLDFLLSVALDLVELDTVLGPWLYEHGRSGLGIVSYDDESTLWR